MQSLSWYWRRIQSMGGPEIAWRIRGLLRDQLDSIRIPLGLIPSIPADKIPAAYDFEAGFNCSPVTRKDWLDSVSKNQQAWRERLIDKADQILDNRLSYFDLESVHHGDPFNWHCDFSAGIDAPVVLSVHTDYRDFETFGDCKLVWEPNRHHQLVVLGRAYVATGEKKYAQKVAQLLRSWIDANPFGYGMNWKSPLELGVRLINWVWAIDLVRDADAFDDELWADILQSVYLAMWDCERKFSHGSSANNHLIGEAAGVFVAARYFSELPNTEIWGPSAQEVLEREILLQTYDDGCTQEHAFGYQLFVIQFFIFCMRAGSGTGHPLSEHFGTRLHAMFRFMNEICLDTGQPPNMGDQDNGYVLDLGELPSRPAELLSVGGYVFEDKGLVTSSRSETVFWLTGRSDQTATSLHSVPVSTAYKSSGYFILRGRRMSVFFDCAPLGYGPIAAHGHADCLSMCLSVNGHPVLLDSGTYDYFTHPKWRSYFRETGAHNTVVIDGVSQSQILGPFMWGRRAIASLNDWSDDDTKTFVSGEHDGYGHLEYPVIHKRELRLNKDTDTLAISDTFCCQSMHTAEIYFHFHPACCVQMTDNSSLEILGPFGMIHFSSLSSEVEILVADDRPGPGWVSAGYHEKYKSTSIVIRLEIDGDRSHQCDFSLGAESSS